MQFAESSTNIIMANTFDKVKTSKFRGRHNCTTVSNKQYAQLHLGAHHIITVNFEIPIALFFIDFPRNRFFVRKTDIDTELWA